MQVAKATVLAILFLLIPHQEPRADSGSEEAAPVAIENPAAGDVVENDGYLWSRDAGRDTHPAPTAVSEHLQTDGYSWSARSDRTARAPQR